MRTSNPPFQVIIGEPNQCGIGLAYPVQAWVNKAFAQKCMDHKLSDEETRQFNKTCKLKVETVFGRDVLPHTFVYFRNNSILVDYVQVPGDACQLGCRSEFFDKNIVKNNLEFYEHNVDSIKQAFCLAMLFQFWGDVAESITDRA